jgi:hypothetical protein
VIGRVAPWFVHQRAAAAPPGVDPCSLALAMFEDLYDTLTSLDLVETSVLVAPGLETDVEPLLWPGTTCAQVPRPDAALALYTLAGLGSGPEAPDAVVVVAADAPDLPPLLIGKAMRALGGADVAYCEASGGGLVLLGARTPVPGWLSELAPSLDEHGVAAVLRAAAPTRRAAASVPGWHRMRRVDDIGLLDPGLEGWDLTRAMLAGHPLRQLD